MNEAPVQRRSLGGVLSVLAGAIMGAVSDVRIFNRNASNLNMQLSRYEKSVLAAEITPRKRRYKAHSRTASRGRGWPLLMWTASSIYNTGSTCPKPLSRKKLKQIAPDHSLLQKGSRASA